MHLYDKNTSEHRLNTISKDLFNSFGKFWKTCKKMKALNLNGSVRDWISCEKNKKYSTQDRAT